CRAMARAAHPAPPRPLRSPCPIAGALDIMGDTWTLLVIRDMLFYGKQRFAEFLDSPEGIATNILTERLRRLEQCGIVEKRQPVPGARRFEYQLTSRGRALEPVLRELIA